MVNTRAHAHECELFFFMTLSSYYYHPPFITVAHRYAKNENRPTTTARAQIEPNKRDCRCRRSPNTIVHLYAVWIVINYVRALVGSVVQRGLKIKALGAHVV